MVGERSGEWKMWWMKNMVGERYVGESYVGDSYAGQKNSGWSITVGEQLHWVKDMVGEQ